MKYALLGSTGIFVSRVSLGTMTFGGKGIQPWDRMGALDQKAADELVGIALDSGVNLFDTADIYAAGESEEILGKALGARRDDIVLATKAYAPMGSGPNDQGLTRLHLTRALDASLRRLGTDHIDLYQVHSFDPVTPLEETLGALDDAVRQGKIRYIGASNFAAWQLMKALGVSDLGSRTRFASLQAYYSLVGRDLEDELLPVVRDQGLGLLVWSPLAGGFLSGKYTREGSSDADARRLKGGLPPVDPERGHDIVDVLRTVAARHDAQVAATALAWVMAQRGVSSVIVGAKRPDQLRANLAAVDIELTERDLRELDAVSAPEPTYPSWIVGDPAARYPRG
ncbi:aldo/keto reductase [Streptomyces sp. NBC_01497]|uniref:aldo/keto reductase n=1 Tax=Streptomyces sp. NBC_01497 TaxID=2903885 RepID=UPI002E2F9857|nr:aldo/keto reductase [Streptomyces sp. NBC_01497]